MEIRKKNVLCLIYLFILVFFILSGGILPVDDNATKNIFKLVFGLIVIILLLFRRWQSFSRTLFLYLIVSTIFICVTLTYSLNTSYALLKYDGAVICVFLALSLFREVLFKYGVKVIFENYVRLMLMILFFTVIYKAIFGFWDRDVRFLINGANVFGWIMGFTSLLCFILGGKKKFVLLGSLFFIALLWSESKGSLLATLICFSIFIIFKARLKYRVFLSIFASLILLNFKYILSFIENSFSDSRLSAIIRVINGELGESDQGSIGVRQEMFQESLNLFLNNPVLGIGLGNYPLYSIYKFDYPHNAHLEIFMECGILFGIIYVVYILYGFIIANSYFRIFILYFLIVSSFSGDISYLKFLLLTVTLAIVSNQRRC